ncbi:MAG: hypothetical protein HN904_06500, partial [Victivallales bacterium]|nr:hypothetical protein [Victivallales bacterium]
SVYQPDAITEWDKNLLFVRGETGGKVLEDVPRKPFTPRQKPRYHRATKVAAAPAIDGKMAADEWPSGGTSLGERTNQRSVRGAPTSVKILADRTHLYILSNVVAMFPKQRKLGTEWKKDEGIELVLQDKAKTVYVLRGFTDGTLRSLTVGGATEEQAKALVGKVVYGASVVDKIWRSEWSVPLAVLGIKPGEKTVLPFNLTAYRSEDDVFAQFAGTLGDTWDLKLGGALMLNWPAGGKTKARPTIAVPNVTEIPAGAWPGTALSLAQTPAGVPLSATPCSGRVIRSGDQLLVRVTIPARAVTKAASWRTDDGAEVCLAGKTAGGKAVTWVIRGYADGTHRLSAEAGAPAKDNAALQGKVAYKAVVTARNWRGEWRLPLSALGIGAKGRVPFNLGVFRSEDRCWINWVGTSGPTWKLANAGDLLLK